MKKILYLSIIAALGTTSIDMAYGTFFQKASSSQKALSTTARYGKEIKGATEMEKILKEIHSASVLDLSGCSIDSAAMARLLEFLRTDGNLKKLRLNAINLDDDGVISILNALRDNKSLTELELRGNKISAHLMSILSIQETLLENKTLSKINVEDSTLPLSGITGDVTRIHPDEMNLWSWLKRNRAIKDLSETGLNVAIDEPLDECRLSITINDDYKEDAIWRIVQYNAVIHSIRLQMSNSEKMKDVLMAILLGAKDASTISQLDLRDCELDGATKALLKQFEGTSIVEIQLNERVDQETRSQIETIATKNRRQAEEELVWETETGSPVTQTPSPVIGDPFSLPAGGGPMNDSDTDNDDDVLEFTLDD